MPLLSIVIATRNRYEYCKIAITIILKLINDECELVLQDNSDNNELSVFVKALGDKRISYSYIPDPLSFVDNFSRAVGNCNGEYICLLGDDDTITADIIKLVHWMKANKIESVTPKSNVDYIWPNASIPEYNHGYLETPEFTGNYYQVQVEQQLKSLLSAGIINYQRFGLPRIYHGIVSKEALLKVEQITGHFFGGLTPDIYATISLSCVIKVHYLVDYPFTIAGACPASASVISKTGGHSGELSSAPHFNHRGSYSWDNAIPRYYSVETIWAETAMNALKEMQRMDLVKYFSKYLFMYEAIIINRKYILALSIKKTFCSYKRTFAAQIIHLGLLIAYFPVYCLKKGGKMVLSRILKAKMQPAPAIDTNILSLWDAVQITEEKLKKRQVTLKIDG